MFTASAVDITADGFDSGTWSLVWPRLPPAQILEGRDEKIGDLVGEVHRNVGTAEPLVDFLADQLQFQGGVSQRKHGFKVETAFERARHFMHTPVAY